MNKQTTFQGGEHSPIPTCSLSRQNIFLTVFYNNLNICFVHIFLMEVECTIYYLSPDPFCYVFSILFLYAEYGV